MRSLLKRTSLLLGLILVFTLQGNSSFSLSAAPQVALDQESGYDRSLFKHWIDADKDGCDTRAEVLISEAVVKPKVDKKCKITGGKWLSAYDGKFVTYASLLDVDHLIPLAEAWRSGAWAWTPKQRQDYANDLDDKRALIAVTLTSNRSKSDQDISDWVPKIESCGYVQNWIAIKIRYSLTYDAKEAKALLNFFEICKFGDIPVQVLAGYSYQSAQSKPSSSPTPSPTQTQTQTIKKMPSLPKPQLTRQEASSFEIEIPSIENWDFSIMTLKLNLVGIGVGDCNRETTISSLPFTLKCSGTLPNQVWITYLVGSGTFGKVQPTSSYSENLSIDSFPKSSTSTTSSPKPTPTATATNSANSPSPSPSTTPTAQPIPSQSQTSSSPAPIKYKNCTDAKAAGVTPITKSSNPALYDLNSGLDRDKDGVACES